MQRDKKLKAHSSGVAETPRYLSFMHAMKTKQVGPVAPIAMSTASETMASKKQPPGDEKRMKDPEIPSERSIESLNADTTQEPPSVDTVACPLTSVSECTTSCSVNRKVLSGPGVSYWRSESVSSNDSKKLFHCPPKVRTHYI